MRREYRATFKAVATHTDQGLFTAVISSETVDRERDVVLAGAMVEALRAWESTHKAIPLAWNHSSAAEDIVGNIDPGSVEEMDGEVVASGWVDQDTPRGAETWRLMKSGTLGFSFGYLVTRSTRRGDGTRVIEALDVFEVSATATPMNNRTRVLSTKSTASSVPTDAELRSEAKRLGIEMPLSDRELRRKCDEIALDVALGGEKPPKPEPPKQDEELALRDLRRRCDRVGLEVALGEDPGALARRAKATELETSDAPSDAELRRKAAELAFPHKPPTTTRSGRRRGIGCSPSLQSSTGPRREVTDERRLPPAGHRTLDPATVVLPEDVRPGPVLGRKRGRGTHFAEPRPDASDPVARPGRVRALPH